MDSIGPSMTEMTTIGPSVRAGRAPSLKTELALAAARKYDETRGTTVKRVENVIFEAVFAMHHRIPKWKFEILTVIGWIIELLRMFLLVLLSHC